MLGALAIFLSCILDLILGDLAWMPHPVVLMGRLISWGERRLRERFPETPRGERTAGWILAIGLPLLTLIVSALIFRLAALIHPAVWFVLAVIGGWQVLALTDLRRESMKVYRELTDGTLEGARKAVARIVGRDTEDLSEEGVTRATVETVAENFSDGVVAPLFFLVIGGVPLALCYKAISTCDSMLGYTTARYLDFGRASARIDDIANWIPARLAALLLIVAAFVLGGSGLRVRSSEPLGLSIAGHTTEARAAARIWRRDRRRHASPNAGQTESAMAGALGVELGGPAMYFGELHDKATLGDDIRPIEPADIIRANRLIGVGSLFALILFDGVRAAVCAALMAGGVL